MPRPPRISYPGALYHITTRGNAKKDIFLNDSDRLEFLNLLSATVKKYHWLCYAFCLMDNHFHLLIETPNANISEGMQFLNCNYTKTFNKNHERTGHIFQGRYGAFLVEKETYLLEVARYIVLNPVRANLIKHPAGWRWSSYPATAGLESAPDFLTTDFILSFFNNDKMAAYEKYKTFIIEPMQYSPFQNVKECILGSKDFTHKFKVPDTELLQDTAVRKHYDELGPEFAVIGLLIEKRMKRGFTQADLARKIGTKQSVISRFESGSYNPTLTFLNKIADALDARLKITIV